MEKPKTLEQLRAEKERAETRLAQEQHKLNRLENRKKFLGHRASERNALGNWTPFSNVSTRITSLANFLTSGL